MAYEKGDWIYWVPMIGPFSTIPGNRNLPLTNMWCMIYHMVTAFIIIGGALLWPTF